MSENMGEVNNKEGENITRRQFLKKAAIATSVPVIGFGLAASLLNAMEKNAVESGISSGSGVFFPLYETHYEGVDIRKISNDLDIFFREVGGGVLTANPSQILTYEPTAYGIQGKYIRLLPDSVLEKLAKDETEIMLGDVITEDYRAVSLSRVEGTLEFFAGLGISMALLRDSLKEKKKTNGNNFTRRKFLKGAAAIGASWFMMPGAYGLLRGGLKIGTVATERENALSRIIDRIYGIQSDLHPEMLEQGMFRNLLMAEKMLTVAEDFEQRTGRKAKIGFNVEYGHNGIEDFLRVGHDVCRWIIERYPTKVLKFVANQNDGNESLWTARLLKLPKDFSPGPNADWNRVEDRKVVDVELQKALSPRLA